MKFKNSLVFMTLCVASIAYSMEKEQAATTQDEANALYNAVTSNNTTTVAKLFEQSANPKALASSVSEIPVYAGKTKRVMFINRIASFRQAVEAGNPEMVNLFIQHGATPEPWDSYDITPLMMAALQGHYDIALRLIKLGANVNAKDKSNQTVLNYAQMGSRPNAEQKAQLTKLLKDNGAVE